MGFLIFVALVVAAFALRRIVSLEGVVRQLRGEIVTLHARVAALTAASRQASGPMPADESATRASLVPDAGPELEEVGGLSGREPGEPDGALEPPDVPDTSCDPPPTAQPVTPGLPVTAHGREIESLERQIGSKWLLYLGVATLVLGVSYFVKFAFDNEWIAPAVRVWLGLAGGFGLVWAGHRFIARGLERYGQTLTGGGVGILYLAIYAAYHWYNLIGRPLAFGAMVAITVLGAWLADRQRSQVLALFAIAIGFLTPFLIGGEGSTEVVLFTYDLILVCGTLFLAVRRDWPALNIVSFMLTALTISSWTERNYRRNEYLTTELFLTAFVVLFLYVLRENRRSKSPIAPLGTFLLGSAPVLYHFASLGGLGPHRGPLLVYLILFSVAGVIAAQQLRTAWLRLAVWFAVAVPFLGIASTRLGRGWLVATWVTLAAIYGLHLIAQIQALDEEPSHVPVPEVLVLHANGLWVLAVVWLLLASRSLDALAPVALALAVFYGMLAFAARRWHRDASLHAMALASVLTASACAMRFSGPWLSVAVGAEGTALVWLGLREGRHWLRHAGSLFFSIGVALLLVLLARPLGLGTWPFLNARAAASVFMVLLLYLAARLSLLRARPEGSLAFTVARLVIIANALTVLAISAEISAYLGWSAWEGQDLAGAWASAELARQLTLSIVWAAYAVALVAIGLRLDYRPIRILAIALFGITIGKVFLIDLAQLDRVYLMFSVIGLGLLLLTASYMSQRLRTAAGGDPRDTAPIEDALEHSIDAPVERTEP